MRAEPVRGADRRAVSGGGAPAREGGPSGTPSTRRRHTTGATPTSDRARFCLAHKLLTCPAYSAQDASESTALHRATTRIGRAFTRNSVRLRRGRQTLGRAHDHDVDHLRRRIHTRTTSQSESLDRAWRQQFQAPGMEHRASPTTAMLNRRSPSAESKALRSTLGDEGTIILAWRERATLKPWDDFSVATGVELRMFQLMVEQRGFLAAQYQLQQSISTVFAPSKPLEPHAHDTIRQSIAAADDIEDDDDAEAALVGAITAGRFQSACQKWKAKLLAKKEPSARAAGKGGEGAGGVHVGSRKRKRTRRGWQTRGHRCCQSHHARGNVSVSGWYFRARNGP
ncbi:hypothetical protein BJ912DRAFT_932308 [Pholiota molesta]|nr:hypothetical protein BJ912DRAFT_932308 [Pholiota molesta]